MSVLSGLRCFSSGDQLLSSLNNPMISFVSGIWFCKEKNVLPVSTAEYNPCGWRAWLNNTTITLGMQNVFDADPSFVAGNFENGYDESIATIKGRFWYAQIEKGF
jgi:hypothetical protein